MGGGPPTQAHERRVTNLVCKLNLQQRGRMFGTSLRNCATLAWSTTQHKSTAQIDKEKTCSQTEISSLLAMNVEYSSTAREYSPTATAEREMVRDVVVKTHHFSFTASAEREVVSVCQREKLCYIRLVYDMEHTIDCAFEQGEDLRAPRRKHHHCWSQAFLLPCGVVPAKYHWLWCQRIPPNF